MPDVQNVADLVRRSAAERGEHPALRSSDQVLTWSELDAQVDAAAAELARIAGGAPVAIALPNVPEFAFAYFGALRAGLVAVPINPTYTGRELRQVLVDSGAGVFVATEAVLAEAGSTAAVPYQLGNLEPVEPVPSKGSGEDLAVLLYTSGTGGAPKGAMLSHRALLANHEQLAALEPSPVTPDDVVLLALPLFHAYGLNSGLGAIAYHGACGVLLDRFDSADFARDDPRARRDHRGGRAADVRRLVDAQRAAHPRLEHGPAGGVRRRAARPDRRRPVHRRPPGRPCTRATGSPRRRRC